MDVGHYDSDVNRMIVKPMRSGNSLVAPEVVAASITEMVPTRCSDGAEISFHECKQLLPGGKRTLTPNNHHRSPRADPQEIPEWVHDE